MGAANIGWLELHANCFIVRSGKSGDLEVPVPMNSNGVVLVKLERAQEGK